MENVNNETVTEAVKVQEEAKVEVKEQPEVSRKQQREQLLRELSKEHGVNLFEPDGLQKFKEFQESQKTEMDKLKEQIDGFGTERQSWESTKSEYEAKLASYKLGISEDSLPDAMVLAKNYMNDEVNLEQALGTVLEKYPTFKAKEGNKEVTVSTQFDTNTKAPQSESEVMRVFKEQRNRRR